MKRREIRFGLRIQFTLWLALFTFVIMATVVFLVRRETAATLNEQMRERGRVLARNLASSCVEPMSLGAERTLTLMLLVREYVQSGGGSDAAGLLVRRASFFSGFLDGLKRLGRGEEATGIRNEGVISAVVTDAQNLIVAYANAIEPPDKWLEAVGRTYAPPVGTGILAGGSQMRSFDSRALNGITVVAVPVTVQVAMPAEEGGEGGITPPAGHEGAAIAAGVPGRESYGAVYLTLSRGLADRAVTAAVSQLVAAALAVLFVGIMAAMVFAALLVKPIRMLRQGVIAIADGDFSQRINIRRHDEIGRLTEAFNDMAKGLAEREVMRGAFSTYVSGDLLAEIIRNPEAMKVGGSRKMATVVFTFFSNHNELVAMAEKEDPEKVVEVINAYLEVQARGVSEFKGYLDKFIGDEVMAVFGVPVANDNHARDAVACALAIQKEVAKLNEERARMKLPTTTVAVGVNSGPLVAGNMGSHSSKLDYTVIGDTVNTAARLGQNARGGQIMISESTFKLVGNAVRSRELLPIEVKGKAEPLRVFEAVGLEEGRIDG